MTGLFAYGTLLPGEPRWHHLQPFVDSDSYDDEVQGTLYDTGLGYPAATFGDQGEGATTIVGRVFRLHAASMERALVHLDAVEGAVAGVYRRVTVETAGRRVVWAYEYGGGLELEPIVGGSWLSRARGNTS